MSGIGPTAMVLAAGLGLRMRPLTASKPKPLVEVAGRALIDYGIDKLRQAGVRKVIVNVHYLAPQIEAWAARQLTPAIEISDERDDILDTGGGVARALARLGSLPFYVINSDSFWIDAQTPALLRLAQAWDDRTMDCLLLLCPLEQTVGFDCKGDFIRAGDGRLVRWGSGNGTPLAYIGAFVVHPRLFANAPEGKFSMNLLWDEAIAGGRLHGVVHDGKWLHVGVPEAIAVAEAALSECSA